MLTGCVLFRQNISLTRFKVCTVYFGVWECFLLSQFHYASACMFNLRNKIAYMPAVNKPITFQSNLLHRN